MMRAQTRGGAAVRKHVVDARFHRQATCGGTEEVACGPLGARARRLRARRTRPTAPVWRRVPEKRLPLRFDLVERIAAQATESPGERAEGILRPAAAGVAAAGRAARRAPLAALASFAAGDRRIRNFRF